MKDENLNNDEVDRLFQSKIRDDISQWVTLKQKAKEDYHTISVNLDKDIQIITEKLNKGDITANEAKLLFIKMYGSILEMARSIMDVLFMLKPSIAREEFDLFDGDLRKKNTEFTNKIQEEFKKIFGASEDINNYI